MKKFIKIAAIVLAVILVILIVTPLLFKDTLLQKTKSTIGQKLNVTVSFDHFNLSLIRNFPNAGLSLRNVLLSGKGAFQGDTLLYVGSLQTKFGLFDLFTPDDLTLGEIILDKAWLNLKVNKDNRANWDIIPQAAPSAAKSNGGGTFTMELNRIEIKNALVTYTDVTVPLDLLFQDINMQVKGRMYGNNTDLKVEGKADRFDLTYDKVRYISRTKLDVNTLLRIDFNKWNFAFSNAEARINGLPVEVLGGFSMPGDSIFFDLSFESKVSLLSDFLKLTPPAYTSYINKIKAGGKASLTGKFKGIYSGETYPELELLMKVADGKIQYEGLPGEIKNINADLSLLKPQGDFNLTSVAVRNAHAEIRNNPVDFNLKAGNLLKDMQFSGDLTGKVNFDHLREVLPLDSMIISGLMDVNLRVEGNKSAIEKKEYGLITTRGNVSLNNFSYSGGQLTMPVRISSGLMDFSPEKITLQHLNMNIGESDMKLTGSLSEYYAYFLTNGILKGNITLNSGFLNLNELMQLQKSDSVRTGRQKNSGADAAASDASSFSVPDRISLTLETSISKALFEKLRISNIKGKVTTDNGRLDLNGLNMNLLNGELNLAGIYENPDRNAPLVNMSLNMTSFDIPTAFQSLPLIRKYIPIASQSKGQFSTTIKLSGRLDKNMNLIMESLNGSGLFNSYSVQIMNSPVFNKIKSVLNENRLSDMKIDDFAAQFTIEDGNLLLKPFNTRISGQDATFSGRLNSNNLIDMDISFVINRDALSPNIENTLAILPGQQNIQKIPVGVTIKGPVKSPEVGIDLSEARRMIKNEVKNASQKEIKNAINKVGQGIKKLFK